MGRLSFTKIFVVSAVVFTCVVVFVNDMNSATNSNNTYSKSISNKISSESKEMSNIDTKEFLSYSEKILSDLLFWREIVCKEVSQSNKKTNPVKDILQQRYKNYLASSKNGLKLANGDGDRKQRRMPKAIIIGAMKCGSLALKTMIGMHSKIVSSEHELQFFDWKYKFGMEWYQSKMPLSYSNQITLEKSPSYFRSVVAPKRMYDMNPALRIILIVRDPTSRSISEYAHHKAHDRCKKSFADLVIRPDGEVEANHPIIMQSMYVHFLKNYLEVFPPEQILVVGGEQFIKDPLPIIKNIEQFLKLEPEITEDNIYFDKEKGYFCMNNNGTVECLPDDKGREHPDVDEHVLAKLRAYFAPYNQRFYELVGQDFGWSTS